MVVLLYDCPFAVAYEDRLIALHNAYAAKGYPVLAINPNDTNTVPDDSFEKMITRAKEKDFPFAYAIDPTQKTAKSFLCHPYTSCFSAPKTKWQVHRQIHWRYRRQR